MRNRSLLFSIVSGVIILIILSGLASFNLSDTGPAGWIELPGMVFLLFAVVLGIIIWGAWLLRRKQISSIVFLPLVSLAAVLSLPLIALMLIVSYNLNLQRQWEAPFKNAKVSDKQAIALVMALPEVKKEVAKVKALGYHSDDPLIPNTADGVPMIYAIEASHGSAETSFWSIAVVGADDRLTEYDVDLTTGAITKEDSQ